MRKLRERLALAIAPWLQKPLPVYQWINPEYTTTSGGSYTTNEWRRTG